MSHAAPAASRWLLALLVGALTLLVAEGGASLLLGRSLLRPATHAAPAGSAPSPTDLDRRLAALRNPGVYRVHPDPFVSYALRSDEQLEIQGSPVHSDALGLRVRPGPPAAADALRLVVLGDSVAFGYGLADDETLACRIEQAVTAMQGGSGRPVVARTVAMPGWNHRNAIQFLMDHAAELDPQLVIYIPIGNDLCDSDGLWETGHRRAAPDLASPDPLLHVGTNVAWPFLRPLRDELVGAGRAELAARMGPNIETSDISAESRRRYDDNAADIRRLQQWLGARGGRLLLARYDETQYTWHLERRLLDEPRIPVVPLFSGVDSELSLPDDPHPNALAVSAAGQWLADDLVARGWVEGGERRPLPAAAEVAERRHARPRGDAEILKLSDERHAAARAALRPAVDWRDATGINQVFGTLNGDGTAGARLLVAVAPAGGTLALELQSLPGQPPMTVAVEVDGRPLQTLTLPAGDGQQWRLPLPARAQPDEALEIKLIPERWIVQDVGGSGVMASFRPLRIACEP